MRPKLLRKLRDPDGFRRRTNPKSPFLDCIPKSPKTPVFSPLLTGFIPKSRLKPGFPPFFLGWGGDFSLLCLGFIPKFPSFPALFPLSYIPKGFGICGILPDKIPCSLPQFRNEESREKRLFPREIPWERHQNAPDPPQIQGIPTRSLQFPKNPRFSLDPIQALPPGRGFWGSYSQKSTEFWDLGSHEAAVPRLGGILGIKNPGKSQFPQFWTGNSIPYPGGNAALESMDLFPGWRNPKPPKTSGIFLK